MTVAGRGSARDGLRVRALKTSAVMCLFHLPCDFISALSFLQLHNMEAYNEGNICIMLNLSRHLGIIKSSVFQERYLHVFKTLD